MDLRVTRVGGRNWALAILASLMVISLVACGEGAGDQSERLDLVGVIAPAQQIILVDAAGEVRGEWWAAWVSLLRWTGEPEHFVFRALTSRGSAIVAADPQSGNLRLLGLTEPTYPFALLRKAGEPTVPDELLAARLPAPLAETPRISFDERGQDDIAADAIAKFVSGHEVAPNLGFSCFIMRSPSGDWAAVVIELRNNQSALYGSAPTGASIGWCGGLPGRTSSAAKGAGCRGAPISPPMDAGRVTATGIEPAANGATSQEPAGLWSEDNDAVAVFARIDGVDGIWLHRRNEPSILLVQSHFLQLLDWTDDGISYVATLFGLDGH